MSVGPNVLDQETTTALETGSTDPQEDKTQSLGSVGTVTAQNICRHREAHPIALDVLMLRQFGIDWLRMEAESLERQVGKELHGLSELNLGKLQALKTLHLVDTYWQRWEVFNWCTAPFNNLFADFEVMQVPTVEQCMVSVDIAKAIRDDMAFGEEIIAFLQVVMRHEELWVVPAGLSFLQVDTTGLPIDTVAIHEMYDHYKKFGGHPTEETITAEQVRKLLDIDAYREEFSSRARVQLRVVR